MNLNEFLERVERSQDFTKWKKDNPKSYLCSFFRILEENDDWQIDFYNPKSDTMTSFLAGDTVKVIDKDSKIFKHKDTEVEELRLKDVKFELETAMARVDEINNEKAIKRIIILQKINKNTTWNLTFITAAFSILNVKIDAGSGEILEQSIKPIIGYKED